jgi:simple sugar transport system ATP-binding protein
MSAVPDNERLKVGAPPARGLANGAIKAGSPPPAAQESGVGSRVDGPPRLEGRGISKRFGALQALSDVSLTLPPGQFRALLGENGAGKSTLVKCIMGTYRADTGSVRVGQHDAELSNPRQAHALGIGMVYQHFTLVENMTVVENLVMAREHVPAIINWKRETSALAAFMERMPFRVDPRARVRDLSAGEKQKVEILKQLFLRRKVMILDEPTSVLTPDEADEVLGMLRGMCTEGRLSVLMISHKFREVTAFCDEVSVLRQGRLTGEGRVCDLTPKAMAEMMMGNATIPEQAARDSVPAEASEDPRLIIDGLTADNEIGVQVLRGLSLKVRAHEIVGIAGVSGNGQRELVRVLAGQRTPTGGAVTVTGDAYGATRGEIREHHFHVLPEMPLQNACVAGMTVAENLAFRTFDRPPLTLARWFLSWRALRVRAVSLIARYNVRPAAPTARMGDLSGGNVQRAVLARELGEEVQVLIAANPCFGLDFKAVAEIRSQIMQARNRGAAVLLVSEDLDEILELADRILVISAGKIVHETTARDADRQVIGHHMAGH